MKKCMRVCILGLMGVITSSIEGMYANISLILPRETRENISKYLWLHDDGAGQIQRRVYPATKIIELREELQGIPLLWRLKIVESFLEDNPGYLLNACDVLVLHGCLGRSDLTGLRFLCEKHRKNISNEVWEFLGIGEGQDPNTLTEKGHNLVERLSRMGPGDRIDELVKRFGHSVVYEKEGKPYFKLCMKSNGLSSNEVKAITRLMPRLDDGKLMLIQLLAEIATVSDEQRLSNKQCFVDIMAHFGLSPDIIHFLLVVWSMGKEERERFEKDRDERDQIYIYNDWKNVRNLAHFWDLSVLDCFVIKPVIYSNGFCIRSYYGLKDLMDMTPDPLKLTFLLRWSNFGHPWNIARRAQQLSKNNRDFFIDQNTERYRLLYLSKQGNTAGEDIQPWLGMAFYEPSKSVESQISPIEYSKIVHNSLRALENSDYDNHVVAYLINYLNGSEYKIDEWVRFLFLPRNADSDIILDSKLNFTLKDVMAMFKAMPHLSSDEFLLILALACCVEHANYPSPMEIIKSSDHARVRMAKSLLAENRFNAASIEYENVELALCSRNLIKIFKEEDLESADSACQRRENAKKIAAEEMPGNFATFVITHPDLFKISDVLFVFENINPAVRLLFAFLVFPRLLNTGFLEAIASTMDPVARDFFMGISKNHLKNKLHKSI